MKLVFWLLLGAMLIWAWQNPEKVRNAGDTSSKWIGEKSRWLADKWDPQAKSGPPGSSYISTYPDDAPLPALPEGVFLLRQEVVVATGRGTVKWPAGSSIRKLGEGAGKALVSDGVNQTTVDPSLLTREDSERRFFYKKMDATNSIQSSSATRALETELAELEAKLMKLQQEKRSVINNRIANRGVQPFSTTEEFLDISIKRAEERRNEIYQRLGKTPRAITAK